MGKINVTGIPREPLEQFFLSRYYQESTAFERMAAVPGGVNPFDRVIPKPIQQQILQFIESLYEQNLDDREALLAAFWAQCEGVEP